MLNAWAAHEAGVPLSALAICGDDIAALCTDSEADAIERNLTQRVFLRVNKKKSWRSERRGVFCEALIEKLTPNSAQILPLTTLTQISAPRVERGLARGTSVLDALADVWRDNTLGRNKRCLAYEECYRLGRKWKRIHGLPTWMGGDGLRTSSPLSPMAKKIASHCIVSGATIPVSKKSKTNDRTKSLRTNLQFLATGHQGVKLSDMSAMIDIAEDRSTLLSGRRLEVRGQASFKTQNNFVYRMKRKRSSPAWKEVLRSPFINAKSKKSLFTYGLTSETAHSVVLKQKCLTHGAARKFAIDNSLLTQNLRGELHRPRNLWPTLTRSAILVQRLKKQRLNPYVLSSSHGDEKVGRLTLGLGAFQDGHLIKYKIAKRDIQ